MEPDPDGLTIGAVAKAAGVNVETVRFYQRRALLPEPDRPYGSIRRYGSADVARVKFVKAAQRLGFSLDEVAGLMKLDDGTHVAVHEAALVDYAGMALIRNERTRVISGNPSYFNLQVRLELKL